MNGCIEAEKLWGQDKMPGIPFPMAAHIDTSSGYGTYTVSLITELVRLGYVPSVYCPALNRKDHDIPKILHQYVLKEPADSKTCFVIFPCVIQPDSMVLPNRRTAYMTMWESTRLTSKISKFPTDAIRSLNSCDVVIVPNAWNASCFSANGIDAPIRIAPLATDTTFFKPVANSPFSTLVFGTAGRTNMGGVRKGFQYVIDAFNLAFPKETDVRLHVKCFQEDPSVETYRDKRIIETRSFLTLEQLRGWYEAIHVLVSGSGSEGWGRHQQEAMCMGRPVIGVKFGGVAEFFDEVNGFPVDWTLTPGEGVYKTMGHYAKPSVESMAHQMRRCYEDRNLVTQKGKLAYQSASRFTISNSANQILAILKEFKIIP